MLRSLKFLISALVLAMISPTTAWSETIIESVTFLDEDGHSFTEFTSIRTGFSSLFKPVDRQAQNAEDALSKHMYFFPNRYKFDAQTYDFNALTTPGPDRSEMVVGSLKDHHGIYTTTPEGNINYRTWDEETVRTVNGQKYFGRFWTGGITKLANVWVIPSSMELVRYGSNVQGDWVRRGNALAFYANNVNNVTFEFEMRRNLSSAFSDLTTGLAGTEVDIQQNENGITLTVLGTILFDSGSAEISQTGNAVLTQIVSSIKNSEKFRISVDGHTDNAPITGSLAEQFPSNWELSAARSLAVLKALAGAGIAETQLEARAFGEHRPRASNASADGRAQNRRIEISLVDK